MTWKRLGRIAWQVALLTLFASGGDWLMRGLRWPVPGTVAGLLLLLALLCLGVVRLEWVAEGAAWLLANMLLFFVPVAMGIVQHKELMAERGLGLLAVIGLSTLLVMAVTGFTADRLARLRRGRKEGPDLGHP